MPRMNADPSRRFISTHISERLVKEYMSIPVWPVMGKSTRKCCFPATCPMIEDDEGSVAFVSQEAKDGFMRRITGGTNA